MDPISSVLHPNPGWMDSKEINNTCMSLGSGPVQGKHCILELYECDPMKLNDEAFIRTTMTIASKNSGATLLNLITHRFTPQGITGLALLAESHLSIHTWPESRYAAVDVFTCGDHTMPDRACDVLRKELDSKKYSLRSLERKIPLELTNSSRNIN